MTIYSLELMPAEPQGEVGVCAFGGPRRQAIVSILYDLTRQGRRGRVAGLEQEVSKSLARVNECNGDLSPTADL
jgi:hypothetical protein